MKVELINPIASALSKVFKETMGVELKRGDLFLRKNPIPLEKVLVIVGVTGNIKGQIIISLGSKCSLSIASKMMMGMEVLELDEMSKSAIGELGNMTAGTYATKISNLNYKVDITTPIVLCGTDMELNAYNQKQIAIPFSSELGDVTIDVSISENS